jgi:hypothetical protein
VVILRVVILCALAVGALAACAPSHATTAPSTSYDTITRTISAPTPTPASTDPVDARPVTAANAASCPLLRMDAAAEAIGMRLARIERLSQATMVIGCRFYALQGSSLSQSEHLPGPNQPALEITVTKYATATPARNAAVALATAGANPHVVTLSGAVAGDVFQTTFDPTDGKSDWVLVFNKGATLVTVKTAIADTSLDAVSVGNAIVGGIT